MNSRIQAYIDGMFAGVALEGEAAELHDELCANCSERYEDLLAQGYSADEAFEFVREGMGDVEELIAPYRRTERKRPGEARVEKDTAPYFEQAFDVTGVTCVEIDARNESISVIPNSGEELVVIYERDSAEGFEAPAITCGEGVLRVQTPRRENFSFTMNLESTLQSLLNAFTGKGMKGARLTIAVPQGMMPQLNVRGGSGSLRLEGVALRGADVHLASGSIRVEPDARVRGDGFGFAKDIQPILDRRCVSCHGEGKRLDLRGVPARLPPSDDQSHRVYSVAYLALSEKGKCTENINFAHGLGFAPFKPPRSFGAARSRWYQKLKAGHGRLTDAELRAIALWIDLAVPFCSAYPEAHAWSDWHCQRYLYTVNKRSAFHWLELNDVRREKGLAPVPLTGFVPNVAMPRRQRYWSE